MIKRRETRAVHVGPVQVGGGAPITVQSMTNTDTADIAATVAQITALTEAGCEIVRVAAVDMAAAEALGEIKSSIDIPLIADIHFDYRLALKAAQMGVDGLRLNPGNIGDTERIRQVVEAAGLRNIPIRIGVNGGSLEKDILAKYGHPCGEALVESAMRHIRILEGFDFRDIKVSLKASSVPLTLEAYRLLAQEVDYPFHIGITEAGTLLTGAVKSGVGLGILLSEGLGDTLRVSLTGDPVDEIKVGFEILKALGLRERGVSVVSCPTCGRLRFGAVDIAVELERRLAHITVPLTVAVMGCVVNGPGEAVEADVGIAGGDGCGFLYIKGKQIRKVKEEEMLEVVVKEVERAASEKSS